MSPFVLSTPRTGVFACQKSLSVKSFVKITLLGLQCKPFMYVDRLIIMRGVRKSKYDKGNGFYDKGRYYLEERVEKIL